MLIKILHHFKVPFSILHDSDYPKQRNGSNNSAWTTNFALFKCIEEARQDEIQVVHRISIPHFEYAHLPIETDEEGCAKETPSKEKPWKVIEAINSNQEARESITRILDELINPTSKPKPFDGNFEEALKQHIIVWAKTNAPGDSRYMF